MPDSSTPNEASAVVPAKHHDVRFQRLTGLKSAASNADVIAKADIIVLGVKPQVLPGLLDDIRSQLGHQQLVLSIAAGVTLKQLSERLGSETRLVRVMPNTPLFDRSECRGLLAQHCVPRLRMANSLRR